VQRWRLRRAEGTLQDRRPGGNPLHRILPEEEQAVLDLIENWGKVDRSHRKLAHRGSYLKVVWVSPSTVRRIVQKHGLSLPKEYQPKPPPARVWPDSITWEPNKIWIWDSRNFTRAKRHVVVIMDVVSRKWIEHIVTPEFTMTQSQLLFMRALESEGLVNVDEMLDDAASVDLADREPILLAWSDNGAQMTGEDTRQFMALVAIWQHFGRPGTPTDQAHIESFFSHLIFDYPHLDHIEDPVVLATELARIRDEYNGVRLSLGVENLSRAVARRRLGALAATHLQGCRARRTSVCALQKHLFSVTGLRARASRHTCCTRRRALTSRHPAPLPDSVP